MDLLCHIYHGNSFSDYGIATYGQVDGETKCVSDGFRCTNLRCEYAKREQNFILVTENSVFLPTVMKYIGLYNVMLM